ncbi:response regulator transcription factor [Psychroflexus gondwanensis]|uniref:Response regulator of the LytR/AlgR family protein n=1 Tax=Psychroflexus gondwanensis ACAM 44 TaxID=1189619 RepID=N1WLP9_9FLAO|nr:LytTR family DNA-binding domain-containing protein [Psychroflexus gondwanensis]EMY79900.1 response regulator of the LytR/AlgR family protein [Psychroflexus gondwanensis ACAM 44]TXE15931.1 response regulator transcription factor [Psychroflexus gondwanensis]
MTNIIIIDDEIHCANVLENLIRKVHSDYIILGIFTNPKHGLEYIQNNPPDLLFLDIEMPHLNGFALLDKLLPVDFDIIFTTAYDQYAIKAFQYSAINYLLKPISEKNIVRALSSWEKRRKKTSQEQWELFQKNLKNTTKDRLKLALPTGVGYHIVEIATIVRCQSDNNYTNVFFENSNKILISRTLKEIDEILAEHGFLRVHQSHLVNPNYVKSILKQDGGSLIMRNDDEVPVSRQKRKQINDILESMLRFK